MKNTIDMKMPQTKKSGLKQLHMGCSFFGTVVVVLLILKLLNWLPSVLQAEGVKKYRSVEDAKAALKIPHIYLPAYFPEYIAWPPAEIFAQRRPFPMIMMHFSRRDSMGFVLSFFQADSKAGYEPEYKSHILYVKKRSTVDIKGRPGLLEIAVCSGRERCNRLSWIEKGYQITLIADDSPEQLLRMAESMY
jgi:hypothetical protein